MAPRRMVGGRPEWSFPATSSRLLGRSYSIAREPASAIVYPDGSPRDWRRQINQWWTVTVWADGEGRERKADLIMTSRSYDTHEQPSRWERPALASGVLFAVLQIAAIGFVAVFVLSKLPPVGGPLPEWAEALVQIPTMTGRIASYLLLLPMPFFLLFLGGLFGVLRRAEGGSGSLAVSALCAGIAMAMTWPMGILMAGLSSDIVAGGGDVATAWSLDGMAPLSLALSAFPRTVLLVATSLLLLGSRLAPRWMGWLGLALAVASLIGTAMLLVPDMFPILALGTLIFELWILALSVSLVRNERTASQAAPQGALA